MDRWRDEWTANPGFWTIWDNQHFLELIAYFSLAKIRFSLAHSAYMQCIHVWCLWERLVALSAYYSDFAPFFQCLLLPTRKELLIRLIRVHMAHNWVPGGLLCLLKAIFTHVSHSHLIPSPLHHRGGQWTPSAFDDPANSLPRPLGASH